MNTAFITGATGFVGSHLVDLLLDKGFKVKCLVRKTSNLRWLEGKDVEYCEGSLSDKESLKRAVVGCNYVFHVAGVLFGKSEEEFIKGNLSGTENIVEACIESGQTFDRFLYVTSLLAAGASDSETPLTEEDECKPFSCYGKSKYESEKYIQTKSDQLPITIIRPGGVYGPRDYAMFEAFKASKSGFNLVMGEKGKLGSIIHVTDLVEGIYLAATSKTAENQTYFLANSTHMRQEEFGELIIQAMGKNVKSIVLPNTLVSLVAIVSEFFGKLLNKPVVINRQKVMELSKKYLICSNEKAKRDFGFQDKIALSDGIKSTLEWYQKHNWL